MAKRFTDSRKWYDPWFRKLPPVYKCFWQYLLDTCNHAGIWKVDIELAAFEIGGEVTEEMAFKHFDSRVVKISESKWFIPKFLGFQYNRLSKGDKCHDSVMEILKTEKIDKKLVNPFIAPTKELRRDLGKGIGISKGKGKGKEQKKTIIKPDPAQRKKVSTMIHETVEKMK